MACQPNFSTDERENFKESMRRKQRANRKQEEATDAYVLLTAVGSAALLSPQDFHRFHPYQPHPTSSAEKRTQNFSHQPPRPPRINRRKEAIKGQKVKFYIFDFKWKK
jgi:hypothetical protein